MSREQAEAAVYELKTINASPRGGWRVEAQRAERRKQLEDTIARASEALQGDAPKGEADPAAASLAAYANAVGLNWAAEQIAPWITAATVLFFEICSGASLIVVSVLAAQPVRRAIRAEEAPDEQESLDADEPEAERRKGRRRVVLPEDVMDRIKGNGGRLNGSLSSIAEQIGAPSKSTAKRVLGELEAAGKIRYDASADGTSVALC